MKLATTHRLVLLAAVAMVAAFAAPSFAAPSKDSGGQMVDEGVFGVMVQGKRIASETFSIHQDSAGSLIKSEFKAELGTDASQQSSELELAANGDLRKYAWRETQPEKADFTVVPAKDFLLEKYSVSAQEKEGEQPFLLPNSTSMLDDYSFVQREVLAWRYLASGCKQEKGQVACPLHQKTLFGTLNPHSRSSLSVGIEYAGREQVTIRGTPRELIRLNLTSDAGDWSLWLDDQFKLQRIVVVGDNIEVVRD